MIRRKNEFVPTWYPTSVSRYETLLAKVIQSGHGYKHSHALKKNIAYNLQYFEYLTKTLQDLNLSGVIMNQTYKSAILTGSGIVESILHYLLVKKNMHKTTEWELKIVMPGAEKKIDGIASKTDSHYYTKLSKPIELTMTYDAMLKKAKSKKIMGVGHEIYNKLDQLKQLRNRVHLQAISDSNDTDWYAFNKSDFDKMSETLYAVLTSNIFRVSKEENAFLEYMKN